VEQLKLTVKNKRKELGLSQWKLAELVGITQPYLSQIENGLRTPSLELALKFSEVLNVTPKIFLSNDVA
jgi:transcriptional regulator with XRE-family HTH domain